MRGGALMSTAMAQRPLPAGQLHRIQPDAAKYMHQQLQRHTAKPGRRGSDYSLARQQPQSAVAAVQQKQADQRATYCTSFQMSRPSFG